MGGTERTEAAVRDEEGGTASSNPDPTMKKGPGSPKGENMPPAGGESMAPENSKHPAVPPGGASREPDEDAS